MFAPVPRDHTLATITWLREEVYPGLVGHPLDDEGIAAWVVDCYIRYRQSMGHEAAKHRVFADIAAVVNPNQPPVQPPVTPGTLRGPITVTNRDFTVPYAGSQ